MRRRSVYGSRPSRPARVVVGVTLVGLFSSSPAGSGPVVQAGTVHVAVASNFADAHAALAAAFEAGTGHRLVVSTGATGQLYAQVRSGAPWDVFLAADQERPALLEAGGEAVAGGRFTYATGRLALFGPGLDSVRSRGADLLNRRHRRIAMANPKLAPYGRAAEQTLERLGLADTVAGRLVLGENIAQTYQFVYSGAAELGFVAYSQVRNAGRRSYWLVPPELHDPIRQDAVLLVRGSTNPAALAYVSFLRGGVAQRIIESFGYGVDP